MKKGKGIGKKMETRPAEKTWITRERESLKRNGRPLHIFFLSRGKGRKLGERDYGVRKNA